MIQGALLTPISQDPVCAASDEEAVLSYRRALETALGSPSAAHPYELYGGEKLSLAKVSLCAFVKHPSHLLGHKLQVPQTYPDLPGLHICKAVRVVMDIIKLSFPYFKLT